MSAHVEDLIDGFVLGALEPVEALRVRAHLSECDTCTEELAAAREVLAALPETLDPLQPRSSVKAGLMAAVRSDAPRAPARIESITSTPRRTFSRAAWASGIAAVVAVAVSVGLLAWALSLNSRLDDRDAELQAARSAAAAFAASAQTLHMESQYAGRAIDAAIAVPAAGNEITVVISGLPDAPDGHGYRLWLLADGADPTGLLLTPDGNGNVVARVNIDLSQFDAMELDAQPLEASAPGGELVIGGPLH